MRIARCFWSANSVFYLDFTRLIVVFAPCLHNTVLNTRRFDPRSFPFRSQVLAFRSLIMGSDSIFACPMSTKATSQRILTTRGAVFLAFSAGKRTERRRHLLPLQQSLVERKRRRFVGIDVTQERRRVRLRKWKSRSPSIHLAGFLGRRTWSNNECEYVKGKS